MAAARGRRLPVHHGRGAGPWRRAAREIVGFALSLHGLAPEESLRMQAEGMGGDRRLGWGIFVPPKSIAAVA